MVESIYSFMGRHKKILTESEQKTVEEKLFVRTFIRRVLSHVNPREINWIIETGIFRSWYKRFPEKEFWAEFVLPDFLKDVDSLKPFTSNWGRGFIEKNWNIYKFMKQKSESARILEQEKFGGDFQIETKKPSSVKEFLTK